MPIKRENLDPTVFGTVEDRVLEILSDGQGYYSKEILEKVKCNPDYLRIVLARLQSSGHIYSKTLPEQSKLQQREPHSKVYFLPQTKFTQGKI